MERSLTGGVSDFQIHVMTDYKIIDELKVSIVYDSEWSVILNKRKIELDKGSLEGAELTRCL